MVPGLKFRQGASSWVVSDKVGNIYRNWSEVPEKIYSLIRPSMFPPPPEEAAKLNLVKYLKSNQIKKRIQVIYLYFLCVLYWKHTPGSNAFSQLISDGVIIACKTLFDTQL